MHLRYLLWTGVNILNDFLTAQFPLLLLAEGDVLVRKRVERQVYLTYLVAVVVKKYTVLSEMWYQVLDFMV